MEVPSPCLLSLFPLAELACCISRIYPILISHIINILSSSFDSKSEPVTVYSICATRSRRLSRLLCASGGASSRVSRLLRSAALLTYGSASDSRPRKTKTPPLAGICARISCDCSGANRIVEESTKPSVAQPFSPVNCLRLLLLLQNPYHCGMQLP